ncbi:MAG: phosphate ABC transporter permease PstA [Anaerolineae bacterium]|nr:phosphate ABC transporter permease PstA [Anaerolineae bacterium]
MDQATSVQRPAIVPLVSNRDNGLKRRQTISSLMTILLALLTFSAVAILFIILISIAINGISTLNLDFFIQPVVNHGIANAITGTLQMAFVGALIAVPLGIMSAVYLSEFGGGVLANLVRWTLDLLAQMPSIVIGLFVWSLLVVSGITGYSGIAGSVALAIIMLPIIGRSAEEILRLVPDALREGAYALGTPRWRVILFIVIPTVFPGLVTGVVLAIARAAGETAPLLLTALGTLFFETNMASPMDAIPTRLYRLALYSNDELSRQQAWGAGLVLVIVVAIFSAFVRLITGRLRRES